MRRGNEKLVAGWKYSLCGVEGGGEELEEQEGWNRHGLGHLHRPISRRTGHCDGCLAECSGECGALEKPWVLWPAPPGPEQPPSSVLPHSPATWESC